MPTPGPGQATLDGGTGTPEPPRQRRAWVEQIMNMPISVHLRGEGCGGDDARRAVAAVFSELRAVEDMFSTFRPTSQVSAINRGELTVAEADPLVQEVVELCEQGRDRTDGFFDAYRCAPDGRVRFDPAGLVKGWAVQRAARHLRALPGREFCLNAGGDIVVGGDGAWRVGIENPRDPGTLVARLALVNSAVATSGTAHRGAHIQVPSTGRPATEVLAATVTGPDLVWADVYATAAVARGRGALGWLSRLEGYSGLVVKPDGVTLVTPTWP